MSEISTENLYDFYSKVKQNNLLMFRAKPVSMKTLAEVSLSTKKVCLPQINTLKTILVNNSACFLCHYSRKNAPDFNEEIIAIDILLCNQQSPQNLYSQVYY